MKSKYTTLIQISLFLTTIAVGISMANYYQSLQTSEKQLKNMSLPLSLDNIYTEIQKNIIEPSLVSSMMANDTFVQNWLKGSEDNLYLSSFISNPRKSFSLFII